jgi:hypothetical protein
MAGVAPVTANEELLKCLRTTSIYPGCQRVDKDELFSYVDSRRILLEDSDFS